MDHKTSCPKKQRLESKDMFWSTIGGAKLILFKELRSGIDFDEALTRFCELASEINTNDVDGTKFLYDQFNDLNGRIFYNIGWHLLDLSKKYLEKGKEIPLIVVETLADIIAAKDSQNWTASAEFLDDNFEVVRNLIRPLWGRNPFFLSASRLYYLSLFGKSSKILQSSINNVVLYDWEAGKVVNALQIQRLWRFLHKILVVQYNTQIKNFNLVVQSRHNVTQNSSYNLLFPNLELINYQTLPSAIIQLINYDLSLCNFLNCTDVIELLSAIVPVDYFNIMHVIIGKINLNKVAYISHMRHATETIIRNLTALILFKYVQANRIRFSTQFTAILESITSRSYIRSVPPSHNLCHLSYEKFFNFVNNYSSILLKYERMLYYQISLGKIIQLPRPINKYVVISTEMSDEPVYKYTLWNGYSKDQLHEFQGDIRKNYSVNPYSNTKAEFSNLTTPTKPYTENVNHIGENNIIKMYTPNQLQNTASTISSNQATENVKSTNDIISIDNSEKIDDITDKIVKDVSNTVLEESPIFDVKMEDVVFDTNDLLCASGMKLTDIDTVCSCAPDEQGKRPKIGTIVDSAFRKHDWKLGDLMFIEFLSEGKSRTGGGISRSAMQCDFSSEHMLNKTCLISYIMGGNFNIPIIKHLLGFWVKEGENQGYGSALDFNSGAIYSLKAYKFTDSANYVLLDNNQKVEHQSMSAKVYQAYWKDDNINFICENQSICKVPLKKPQTICEVTVFVVIEFCHSKAVRFAVNTFKAKTKNNVFQFFTQLIPSSNDANTIFRPPFWQWNMLDKEKYDDFVNLRGTECVKVTRKKANSNVNANIISTAATKTATNSAPKALSNIVNSTVKKTIDNEQKLVTAVAQPEPKISQINEKQELETIKYVPAINSSIPQDQTNDQPEQPQMQMQQKRGRGRPRKDVTGMNKNNSLETLACQKRLLIAKQIWLDMMNINDGKPMCPLCTFPLSGSKSVLSNVQNNSMYLNYSQIRPIIKSSRTSRKLSRDFCMHYFKTQ